jgi:hypothetical protein
MFLISFLYIDLYVFGYDPLNFIKKILQWLTECKWVFEGNVMVYLIHCLQTSNYYMLTIISYMFLVNEALLSYCSVFPQRLGVLTQFEG